MKRIRQKGENLEEILKELKVGDEPVFDSAKSYEIIKVPNGFIYKHEYCGMCFVPDANDKVGNIKGSVAKNEPKKIVAK